MERRRLVSTDATASSPKLRELIPGLPNDLAMEVFLHLPAEFYPAAMAASSLWRVLHAGRRFYVQRRLRFPYPSIILCHMLDRPPHQGAYSVCQLLELDLSCPSLSPRPIARHAFLRLFPPFPCSVKNVTHRRSSGLVCSASVRSTTSSATAILLVNEGNLRWMYFNITCLKLGYFQPDGFRDAPEFLFTFMGYLGPHIFMFHKGICWSYNCTKHVWRAHGGLGEGFAPDVSCRFGFGGNIFVKDVRSACIYAFDASTSEWKLQMQMTQRLSDCPCFLARAIAVSSSALVVATPSAIIVSAFENLFVKESVNVVYQQAGTTEWCHFLEIKHGEGSRFHLLNKEEQVFLIVTNEQSSFRYEIHHSDHFILTCIFLPFHLFMNPFVFEG